LRRNVGSGRVDEVDVCGLLEEATVLLLASRRRWRTSWWLALWNVALLALLESPVVALRGLLILSVLLPPPRTPRLVTPVELFFCTLLLWVLYLLDKFLLFPSTPPWSVWTLCSRRTA